MKVIPPEAAQKRSFPDESVEKKGQCGIGVFCQRQTHLLVHTSYSGSVGVH
jgi:hypothetical protein